MKVSIDRTALEDASGIPESQLAMGQVGGTAKTGNYVRLEGGRLLVEVTLQPSGEQVVATVNTGGGENAFYLPLAYGDRVVLDWPGGDGQAVILARLNDRDGPFPTFGVPSAEQGQVPLYTALKTGSGQLVLIESGDDGDVLLHSGGSVQLRADSGYQVLVSARTHIGVGAQFASEPTGACVGAEGKTVGGSAGGAYAPAAHVPMGAPIPPVLPPDSTKPVPVPADGIVRVKDSILSNSATDSGFWAFLIGLAGVFIAWAAAPGPDPGGVALKGALSTFFGTPAGQPPTSLASEHRSASLNTASDA